MGRQSSRKGKGPSKRTPESFKADVSSHQTQAIDAFNKVAGEGNPLKDFPPTNIEDARAHGYTPAVLEERRQLIIIARNQKLTLEPPFPSAPKRNPTHLLSFFRKGNFLMLMQFSALYAARRFLDAAFEGTHYKWQSEHEITSGDISCKCDQDLEALLEHKLTKDEKAWIIPPPYDQYVTYVRTGEKPRTTIGDTRETVSDKRATGGTPRAAPASKEGLTSLADVCKRLKVDPREARQTLRKSTFEKPQAGWHFTPAQVKEVEALIKDL